ncbi:CHAT domain-containing protein [Marisediminitalea sp.]|uniref:CHAT domain-containing protein n=1 Tax=Marisediminitalea sp. TaxID=2662268 RepID=UPI0035184FBD
MEEIYFKLKDALFDADLAFFKADWSEAIIAYQGCTEILDEIWLTAFYPSVEIRKLTENVSTHLAYALAKEDRLQEAVLAIENGKARYLTRLLAQKSDHTGEIFSNIDESSLDVIQEYLFAADHLTTLYSERSHPSLIGKIDSNCIHLHLAIQNNLSPKDLLEYTYLNKIHSSLMENENFYNQVMYVIPKAMKGEDPEAIPYYDSESFYRALAIQEKQRELLKKYDFSNVIEDKGDEIATKEKELKALSLKLPKSWLLPSWSEVEMSLGCDSNLGGYYFDYGPIPLVYLIPTVHGSVVLIVEPTINQDVPPEIQSIFLNVDEATIKEISLRTTKLTRSSQGAVSLWDRWKNNDLMGLLVKLWSIVMGPIVAALQNKQYKSAIFIPTGVATNLPLHAATSSRNRSSLFANEIISISYAPSARLTAKARVKASQLRNKVPSFTGVFNPTPTELQPLPFAEREIQFASARFFERWGARWIGPSILTGKDAMRFSMSGSLGGEYHPIVHFACHAYFDTSDPLRGGIMLSGDEPLSLADVLQQKTCNLRIAILSCCDSGLTDEKYVNESIGFPGGLLAAGCAGVISTLWPVSDLGASLLMIRFYDAWLDEGLSPATALAKSQSWMIRTNLEEKIKYFSDSKFQQWEGKMPEEEYERRFNHWRQFREDLKGRNKPQTALSNPIYWAGFFYTGV